MKQSLARTRRWVRDAFAHGGILAALALAAACSDAPTTSAASGETKTATPSADGELRWSDAAAWPNGSVPAEGDDVVIPAGARVVLDASTPSLNSLAIAGELVVADRDVELVAGRVHVTGRLTAGTAGSPHASRFVITLTGTPAASDIHGKGITVDAGGELSLHGEPRATWTRLAGSVPAGATSINLVAAMPWRAGDRVVLAPTGDDPAEAEVATVRSASGTALELEQPLRYQHRGEDRSIAGRGIEFRAEVGLLSHNIVIRGDEGSESSQVGAQVMVMRGGVARVDGVEFTRVGQRGRMARYPFHWHMAGSVGGQYLKRSSVSRSYNRCVTVHGTHDAVVSDNVCHDHVGHGFFLEDGIETGNTFRANLGMVSRKGELLPSDQLPATYWITNPDNTYEHNVAAGSIAHGFWVAAPKHPTGLSATTGVWPMHAPLRRFHANVAHSNDGDAFHVEEDGSTFGNMYRDFRPRANGRPDGAPAPAVWSNLYAYRNGRGFWARGDFQRIEGGIFVDNRVAVQIGDADVSSRSSVSNALIVGASGLGAVKVKPYRGVLIYDGPVAVRGVTFANFAAGEGGAIGPAPGYDGRASVLNTASGVTFVNANPYYVAPSLTEVGERMVTLRDLDGSFTGTAGGTVATTEAPFTDASCAARLAWNARVCPMTFVTIRLSEAQGATPAVVEQTGGGSWSFPGYSPSLLIFSGPTGHTYAIRPSGLTGQYNLEADGLTAGVTVTVSAPWPGPQVRVSTFVNGAWQPIPLVASLAALGGLVETAAWYDPTAKRVHVRFVGTTDERRHTVGIRPPAVVQP